MGLFYGLFTLVVFGVGIYLLGVLFIIPVFEFAPDLIYLVLSIFITFVFLLITAGIMGSKDTKNSLSANILGCLGMIIVPIGGIISLYFIFKIIA